MKQFFIFILILLLANSLVGQHSKPDTLKAMFNKNQIKLDGELNEDF
ncbi:MAG: hypothetical protein JEY97_16200 [Bacteroidales bacterium]|nr:hypothetical protein [Bacteroidales bacterium]